MSKNPRVKTSNFFNSNLTTIISISMVLFLVGLITTLALTTKQASDFVKENIQFTIVLEDSITNPDLQMLETRLKTAPYVKSTKLISKERALQELSNELGEMPEDILGYNPLKASIEVNASADYANAKSMENIRKELSQYDGVSEVIYQKETMEDVNSNIQVVQIVLAAVAILMLVISIGLINLTIRLHLYSKRFIINTMKLVGATSWFIRRPFVVKGLIDGLVAAIISSAVLESGLYYVQQYYGFALFDLVSEQNVILTVGVMVIFGMSISMISSMMAVGRYLHLKTNDLYYI